MGHGQRPVGCMEQVAPSSGSVDSSARRVEAVQILLATRALFEDEELQEHLAGIDEQCGGVLASWRPPWVEEGVECMDFPDEILHGLPLATLIHWACSLEEVMEQLSELAREAELIESSESKPLGFTVVVPQSLTEWPLRVIETIARLGGGHLCKQHHAEKGPLMAFSRLLVLDALSDVGGKSKGGCRSGLEPLGKQGTRSDEPCSEGLARPLEGCFGCHDPPRESAAADEKCGEPVLRQHALLAVLGATPAAAIFAEAQAQGQKGQNDSAPLVMPPCEPAVNLPETPSLPSKPPSERFDPPSRKTTDAQHGKSSAASENSGRAEYQCGERASLPSSIKFVHLHALKDVTESQGEAAGLILAVMHLLQQDEVRQKFAMLDSFCEGLLSNWKPPWAPEDEDPVSRNWAAEDISAERLAREDESTVFDWAMSLDGFLSFVANLALAARSQQAQAPTTDADASAGRVSEMDCKSEVKALVVVVPDNLADWHLEVFGPLLQSFGMFMLSEKAWRADFEAARTVPFSVEVFKQVPSETSGTMS
eukprot:TRINITY_DN64108_c0_g1_i1.p1 TRINITY_DN64108_c0_g1~~TRINITY_DN64108_c0_g1_i1.p1  ORF type:complete len:538 (+),score=125.71 TRINITY_DN64108_c0_g1_i1:35-1648(+)